MLISLRDRLTHFLKPHENKAWKIFPVTALLLGVAFIGLLLCSSLATHRDFTLWRRIGTWPLCLNVLVLSAVFTVLYACSNRWAFSTLLTLCGAATLVTFSTYKYRILGSPFMPGDFELLPQGIDMMGVLFSFTGLPLLVFFILCLLALKLLFRLYRVRRLSLPLWKRTLALGGGLLLLAWPCAYGRYLQLSWMSPVDEVLWDKNENYNKNGLLVMFLIDTARMFRPVPPPAGYSTGAIEQIARKSRPATAATPPPASDAEEPANVIVFLAESFCDVQALNITTTGDPTPFFHSLRRDGVVGTFLVPTYGGITVRTEFEVLTGLSMAYLPEVVDPYAAGSLNLNRQLPTLPRFFAEHQYRTAIVHACAPLSECREVYPEFGFQRFYSADDMKNPKKRGQFISDETLVDKIIELSDESAARGEPYFIMANSMSTHGPYDESREADEPLDVVTTMSQASHRILKTYINTVARLDTQWRRLADHFKNQKSRTLIVIFGDHMPPLGEEFMVYKELGYYASIWSEAMETRIHMTPVAAWANYKLPGRGIARRASTLYSFIIKSAGLPLETYGEFNDYLARTSTPENKLSSEADTDFRMVQFDLLYGAQYLRGPQRSSSNFSTRRLPPFDPFPRPRPATEGAPPTPPAGRSSTSSSLSN